MCRRKDVTSFLNGLKDEDISTTMRVLLMHLKNSPPHHKPLIAVLLLHFDLLVCSNSLVSFQIIIGFIISLAHSKHLFLLLFGQ